MVVAVSKDTLSESHVRHGAGMLQLRRLAWHADVEGLFSLLLRWRRRLSQAAAAAAAA